MYQNNLLLYINELIKSVFTHSKLRDTTFLLIFCSFNPIYFNRKLKYPDFKILYANDGSFCTYAFSIWPRQIIW